MRKRTMKQKLEWDKRGRGPDRGKLTMWVEPPPFEPNVWHAVNTEDKEPPPNSNGFRFAIAACVIVGIVLVLLALGYWLGCDFGAFL